MTQPTNLLDENTKLRAALKFYADTQTYCGRSGRKIWDDAPDAPICEDMGEKAREALK